MNSMDASRKENGNQKNLDKHPSGFGTFMGVYVPCILMLFGVIIFLRLGWITGQAGLFITLCIVSLASLIVILTALCISSIATNGNLGRGGMYYILSRSLGLEAGAALGIPLFLKQSFSIAFCVVGFAESLHDLVPSLSITTIGIWTLIIFTLCACASLKGALKLQVGIFVILAASLVSLFTGSELRNNEMELYEPSFPISIGFWGVFAIFFPALTGMESSVSLSGDLRNPSKSLPLGIIGALLSAYAVYMLIPIFLVYHVPFERLRNDMMVMQDIASIPSLIILGIWAATLSSALGGLLGAPRTLQAIAEDGLVPEICGKTYGPNKEPIVATLITFIIALFSVYYGSVNKLAPLLTMICLICYGTLNFAVGLETLIGNPSWRPRFQIHWSIAFLGSLLCMVAMLMIDPGYALVAIGLVLALYFFYRFRQIQASWDDLTQGILLYISRFAIYRLAFCESSSKSWRPHFLVFTKRLEEHTHSLVRFSQSISQSKSLMTMVSFLQEPFSSEKEKQAIGRKMAKLLQQNHIEALVQLSHTETITEGMKQIIQHYGFGPIVPNTIVFGGIYEKGADFAEVVRTAYQKHYNVVILNDRRLADLACQPSHQLVGDLHIWWDNQYQHNEDFMLVLAYMLKRNPAWSKAKIRLNGIAPNELKRQNMLTEFRELGKKRRLPLNVEVFVLTKPEEEFYPLVSEISKDAALLFLGFRPPYSEETMESYADYLRKMFQAADALPSTALVLSSEHTPLEHILK